MYETCKRHLAGVVGLECSQKILMMVDDRMGPWCFMAPVPSFLTCPGFRWRRFYENVPFLPTHRRLGEWHHTANSPKVGSWVGSVILRLMNYESDGSTTNLTSCKVFFLRMTFQREWCSTDNTVLAECHRNKAHFLVEPCVGALLQKEICRSFHFHILDSRGSTIFSVEVRHACMFVTMNMCRSNILKVLYWNMHAGELL